MLTQGMLPRVGNEVIAVHMCYFLCLRAANSQPGALGIAFIPAFQRIVNFLGCISIANAVYEMVY